MATLFRRTYWLGVLMHFYWRISRGLTVGVRGMVLDSEGRVVGVVYAKDSNGHSFVVPVSTLRSMLDDEASFTPTAPCAG